jgi:hypothetical protein
VALRTLVKESGTGVQGHSRSPIENARALLHVEQHRQQGLSFDAAVKATAKAELTSTSTVRGAIQEFVKSGTLSVVDTSNRGSGNPAHPLHHLNCSDSDMYGPSFETELLIHTLVHSQKTDGVSVTATTIAAELREKRLLSVETRTVRRWLRALDYRWRHKRYVGGMKPQAKHVRIRQFILEYAAALKEEADGTATIVYMDESYIHTHIARKHGWFPISNRDVVGDDNGSRLIILHAMTDRGLLAVPDEVASNWLSEPALTAELVFEDVLEDGQDDSDYHNTMNGVKFTAWVRNRLLPTFNKLYPRKKMYLVLDNAAYHKPRDETWIESKQAMNKHDLAHQLMDLGVTQLATSNGRIVPSHLFEASIGEHGPSKEDLIAATQLWLDQHPDYNRTVVEQLMNDAGHSLIFTPPYCPEVQPIELLWAKIKRYVADRSTLKRSATQTREQTEEAFEKVTAMFCNSVIKHCHDWIDQFLQTDAAEDLKQCGTLAGVIRHLNLLKIANQPGAIHSPAVAPAQAHIAAPAAPAAAASSASPARTLRHRH